MELTATTPVYAIVFNNYIGDDFNEYYLHLENALKRFNDLKEEAKMYKFPEYEENDNSFSYFNPNINEYSTYIDLLNLTVSSVFIDLVEKVTKS